MSLVHFTLYVAGDSPRSRAAEANLRRLCDDRLAGRYAVTVVDVTEAAERAEQARILTTPTVVNREPVQLPVTGTSVRSPNGTAPSAAPAELALRR